MTTDAGHVLLFVDDTEKAILGGVTVFENLADLPELEGLLVAFVPNANRFPWIMVMEDHASPLRAE